MVVVSSQGAPSVRGTVLSSLNSTMRRIDLSCKLLAPIAAGLLMSLKSTIAAAVFIAVWNALSTFGEYYFLHIVYQKVPALAEKAVPTLERTTPALEPDFEAGDLEEEALVSEGVLLRPRAVSRGRWLEMVRSGLRDVLAPVRSFVSGWRLYAKQETVLAGVALALLYLTVLR